MAKNLSRRGTIYKFLAAWIESDLYPQVRAGSRDVQTVRECLYVKVVAHPIFDSFALIRRNDHVEIKADDRIDVGFTPCPPSTQNRMSCAARPSSKRSRKSVRSATTTFQNVWASMSACLLHGTYPSRVHRCGKSLNAVQMSCVRDLFGDWSFTGKPSSTNIGVLQSHIWLVDLTHVVLSAHSTSSSTYICGFPVWHAVGGPGQPSGVWLQSDVEVVVMSAAVRCR